MAAGAGLAVQTQLARAVAAQAWAALVALPRQARRARRAQTVALRAIQARAPPTQALAALVVLVQAARLLDQSAGRLQLAAAAAAAAAQRAVRRVISTAAQAVCLDQYRAAFWVLLRGLLTATQASLAILAVAAPVARAGRLTPRWLERARQAVFRVVVVVEVVQASLRARLRLVARVAAAS